MLGWLKNLYAGYSKVVADVQELIDDLAKIKRHGFVILNATQDEDKKLSVLRYINQVLDSELAARRYKQSERRIQHTFVITVLSLVGGGIGALFVNLVFK